MGRWKEEYGYITKKGLFKTTYILCGAFNIFALTYLWTIYFYDKEVKGSKYAETLFRKLDDEGNVEVQLLTGRTHQIRASFAHLGCPLVGDVKYGATKNGKKDFQQLRAYKIVFDFKDDGGELGYLRKLEIRSAK